MSEAYEVFVIDPPWKKKKGGLRKARPNQERTLGYETLSTEEIFSLLDKEIFTLSSENHCIFIWCIDQFLLECESEMEKRGYRRHCRFIWNKLNGVAPAFTVRYSHEYLIWFYKKKLPVIDVGMRGKLMTVFEEKAREHSRKPNLSYTMIEQLYPLSKRMDVFSREKRDGWSQFGDQCDYFSDIKTNKI